jgi:hypothetical protein
MLMLICYERKTLLNGWLIRSSEQAENLLFQMTDLISTVIVLLPSGKLHQTALAITPAVQFI